MKKNVVTECDNNTSSEDDSLLICSETIDNAGCNIPEVPSAAEFFKNIAESKPVKNPADNGAEEMPQTVEDCQEAAVDPVSLQDGGVSLLDIDGSNVQKVPTKDIETAGNYAKKSMENVTVQRLDDSSGISDLVKDCLPGNIYSESSQVDNEDENSLKFDLESDVQSSLQGVQENDQNVTGTSAEDGPPVENALQIIASFVESMEGSSFEKHEEVKHTTTNDHQLDDSSGFLSELPSSSQETPILVPSAFTLEEKTKDATEPSPTVSHSGKIIDEGQSLSVLSQSEDDSWDVSDAPIDVLSTSTSSSNSIPESTLELTEKEMKALEAFGSVRTSGRKRKPPSSLDVSPPRQISGWVRGALSLLQKVASYRGQGRRKGDFSAATWFLKPVDPVDAPGYYKVIKTPMDFGTVRVKLESGKYQEYSEFHSDMLLVKSNCLKYNPPGHHVRQDCEEVFRFYEAEYAKMLERWEKCHVSPAKKPRQASKTELPGSM